MNKSSLIKVKKLLADERCSILQQVKQDIDIDTDGDETDLIQGNLLIELTNHLNYRNSSKLKQIEEALKQIENKTYGLCIVKKQFLKNDFYIILIFKLV
jgi:RNA polymerase-binding transcription factor DksA